MKKKTFLRGLLAIGMVFTLTALWNTTSLAQKDYPNREIELVVPFSAGA